MNNQKLLKGLPKFKESGKFSDLTIHCGTRTWPVHHIVLSTQSDFFRAACEGGFQEALTQSITLKEEKLEFIDRMITFFYSGDYSDENGREPKRAQALLVNAFMYVIGDKFGIEDLKKHAATKTHSRLANSESGDPLSWNDMAVAIRAVWKTTNPSDKGLRFEYIKKVLMVREYVAEYEDMTEILLSVPGFWRDVLLADWRISTHKHSDPTVKKVLKCWKCNIRGNWSCGACNSADIAHDYTLAG